MATPNATSGPSAVLAPPAVPALDNTYGVLLLGTSFGLLLQGVIMHQGYRYACLPAYKQDSLYTKTMVALVLILETWHSAISMHAVYFYLTTNYFNPAVLFQGVWYVSLFQWPQVLSSHFFARRLWLVDRKFRPLVVFVIFLLLGEAALSTTISVEAFIQPNLVTFESVSSWMVNATLGMIIAADVLLTTLLTIVLRRSRTGFQSTDSVLNILIVYTINTGLLTGALSTLSFLLAIFFPHTFFADGMNMCIAKLYANSLLAVLNSRDFLKGHRTNGTGLSESGRQPPVSLHNVTPRVQRQNTTTSRGAIEIKLERDVVRSSHPSDELRRDEYELEKISTRYPTGGLSGGTAPSFEPPV
ncbi:uncharacterized protein TRAVEDRAFT_72852 [Trametes versicolor FP-101664 SS1]|uniref:uncharacterized protein n=1 Tax=Trametes versicolor (strain FP-101664) TaxID=717944 RepID=UPI0004623FCA|nr:uncharacterized protein TRAVEDRAFT_72852 [Trametes versicolor FP-101664 SS1]EIW57939.1 hypothetical protein TRAVEDRAFT_72852 [Trametes versicolor FP-101664 SS1]